MNNNQNNTSINKFSSEDQIDIKPMLKTLYRGKKYLFGIPLITSIIVAIFSLFEVPVWRGNFQIVIGNSNDKGNLFSSQLGLNVANLLGSKAGKLDIVTQELILKSPSVLNPVYEYVLENKIFEGEYTFSDWINGPLGFKVETGSNVINISYKDNDKDFILKVLKKISLEYKNYSTRDIEKGLVKQIKYLENQNEIMRKAAKKSINALNEFQIKHGLGTMYGFVGENDDFSSFQNMSQDSLSNTNNEGSNATNEAEGQRFAEQFALLEKYEAEYSKYSAILKPESVILKDLKVKIENMSSLLKRPNEILIQFNELKRAAKRDQLILNKVDGELILLKLEQSKEQKPWDIISEPTIEKYRFSPNRKLMTLSGFLISFFITAVIIYLIEKRTKIIFEESELNEKIKCKYIDTLYKDNQFLNDELINKLKEIYDFELILSSELMNKKTELISKNNKISYKKLEDCFNKKIKSKLIMIVEKGKILENDIFYLNKYANVFPEQIIGWLLLK